MLKSSMNGGVSQPGSLTVCLRLDYGSSAETRARPLEPISTTSSVTKAENVLARHHAERTGLDVLLPRTSMVCGSLCSSFGRRGRPAHLTYNIGAGQMVTAPDLLDAGANALTGGMPPEVLRQTTPPPEQAHMNIARIRDEFGSMPRVPLEAGVRDFADWVADHAL